MKGYVVPRGVRESALTRILVAFNDEYSAYRGVIAAGIELLRPDAEVATSALGELEAELGRFDPQMVICGMPDPADSGGKLAWVELPLDPARPSRVRVGEHYRETAYLSLGEVLAVVDEVEALICENVNRTGKRERLEGME